MSKAQQIYDEVASGSPRSAEFLAGVHYILMLKLDGVSLQRPTYPYPSSQLDAWMWGCEYGHDLVARGREHEVATA
ncbi:hypothetical protein PAERUG_P60_London_6_VIM_2_11_13_06601 [Pseudomonas aeruginosa]|nr:hypothetical protein PAERUG_P43_2_London_9_VIM_2_11_12_02175 [Pseudomonas aeruginosa]CRQ17909.1 hypothetical protein PAERUG_E7_London_9_VIM_2_02_13_05926 [Pseudomonas aeruginosa]CRQ43875.1 hypothetical protein PAERUG_P43_1_London_9_VIM_2_11_12_02331 [Pseudomonas aeruginosa]CRQ61884.1 hypothetical protein PAERUG_P50_London_9_VIM_2_01_13_02324 [Pseudomonas aeruginosa]CRQ82498.1 hypothetical protein PAERUG_P51_1_London_9_VIM_2_02_13_02387 [Pseudomonas aeruginosa]